jgi:hypothetical protein
MQGKVDRDRAALECAIALVIAVALIVIVALVVVVLHCVCAYELKHNLVKRNCNSLKVEDVTSTAQRVHEQGRRPPRTRTRARHLERETQLAVVSNAELIATGKRERAQQGKK